MGEGELGNPERHVWIHVSVVAEMRRKSLEISIPTWMVSALEAWEISS